jgi:hypothetical protein
MVKLEPTSGVDPDLLPYRGGITAVCIGRSKGTPGRWTQGQVTYTVMHPADRIYAPWTPEQAANLNGYQFSGAGHPFTCGVDTCLAGDSAVGGHSRSGRTVMLAAADGWECPACGWRQNWALRFMLDRSWERPGPWALCVTTPAVAAFPVVRALDRIRTCRPSRTTTTSR